MTLDQVSLGAMKYCFPLALLLCLAAGCATPASRIKKNPEAFNQLTPEIQTNVLAGRIDLGYTREAVELALGPPHRQYTRRVVGGKYTEVWSYTSTYTTTEHQRVDARVRCRDASGRTYSQSDWVYVDVDQKHEYERLRVEFENNTVAAIETLER